MNNAIVFDFRELSAWSELDFFNVLIQDLVDSYEIPLIVPPLSGEPFSIVVPFSSFVFRGGGAALPEFSAIRSINMELRLITGSGPEDMQFQMELDRIRFVRIPEPTVKELAVCGLAVAGCMRSGRGWQ